MTRTSASIPRLGLAALGIAALTLAACAAEDRGGDPEIGGGWELVWSDEFVDTDVNPGKWDHEVNCWGGGNGEQQCYTDRPENIFVEDGRLKIRADRERFSGPRDPDDAQSYRADDTGASRPFTSARVRTKGLADWTYGRIEVRAKLPQGQGIWPAIWLLSSDGAYGTWPLSGEIDIMEAVNLNTPHRTDHALAGEINNEVHGTLHYGQPWPNNRFSGVGTEPDTNVWEKFHTYAIEWEQGEMRWYVDGEHFATQVSDHWFTTGSLEDGSRGGIDAPFDRPFYLILNVAVGGAWPGPPNAETVFPQTMEVEYVRVYQCSVDPVTGRGCASVVDPEIEPLPGNEPPDFLED
jgi:beta-glucanase (GH16 family)